MVWRKVIDYFNRSEKTDPAALATAWVKFKGQKLRIEGEDLDAVRQAASILSGDRFSDWRDCAQDITCDDFMALVGYYCADKIQLRDSPNHMDRSNHLHLAQKGLLEDDPYHPLWAITAKGKKIVKTCILESCTRAQDQKYVIPWNGFGIDPWPLLISPQFRKSLGVTNPIEIYSYETSQPVSVWETVDHIVEERQSDFPFLPDLVSRAKFEYKVRFLVFPGKGAPTKELYEEFLQTQDEQDGS